MTDTEERVFVGNDSAGKPLYVGDYAYNIENGWTGKIIDIDNASGVVMYSVDYYAILIGGQSLEQSVDTSDTQWHTPEDLVKVNLRERS